MIATPMQTALESRGRAVTANQSAAGHMTTGSLEGQTLGQYQVLAPLGAGGMARVYRAYHPQLARYVAVKVLRDDLAAGPEFLARFRREAQAVAGLRHPHIVQVFDFDAQGDVAYMVMELLEGDTLKARLHAQRDPAAGSALPLGEAGRVMLDALDGLGYAHGEGLIHRDLKPANLMLTRRGQVVLTDFGIAQMVGATPQTLTGTLLGTLNYMAPEQGLRGECSPRSDLYALGIVLYEMLTGRVPFEADTPLAILMKHANAPLPAPRALNPALPAPLERVLLKALAKEPEARYASAAEMSADLQAALHEAGVTVPESLAVPERLAAPDQLAAPPSAPGQRPLVVSGQARAALAGAAIARDATEPLPRMPAAEAVTARGRARAIYVSLWTVAAVNLLSLALAGALGRLPQFASAGWPAEVLLAALTLSLLMEALATPWLVIPVSILADTAVLLGYYAASGQWRQWFWWPVLALVLPAQCVLLLRWARPRLGPSWRARRLGLAANAACAALMVLELALALVIATR